MERSMNLQADEKFSKAVETLSQLGFPRSLIIRTLRSILKLYAGEWKLIEENGYQVVVERILEDQDANLNETKASKKMCHDSTTKTHPTATNAVAKSEQHRRLATVKQQNLPRDAARNSAIKLGKGSDSNYLSAVRKLYEQFKQRAHSSSLPPLAFEMESLNSSADEPSRAQEPPAAGTNRPAPISEDPSSSGSKGTADILNVDNAAGVFEGAGASSPPSVPPSPIPSPPPSPPPPPPPPPPPSAVSPLPFREPSPLPPSSLEFLPPPPPLPPNVTPLHISMYPPPPAPAVDTQPSPPVPRPAERQAVEHFQPGLPPFPYLSTFPVAEPPVWDNQQAFQSPWGSNPYLNEWSFPQALPVPGLSSLPPALPPFPNVSMFPVAVWDNQAPLSFPPASTSFRGCGGWLEDDD